MEPGPRNRISDLYHRALECRPEERDAFLKGACDGDPALLREVESLLRYESDAAPFLETPAAVAGDFARTLETSQMIGRQLGPYTITAPLGAGGMGEVYRARDSKLGRDVAIKILPSHFTADPERRSRFAREARLLATLNHPHIGAIYGLEEIDGVTALVLELVEGPTLADRLARGPLPIAEALAIARQIAEALDAAHEKGIVHRDLKPANIVLQGAAWPRCAERPAREGARLRSGQDDRRRVATGTRPSGRPGSFDGTAEGRILGTPAYMSPEQARGQAVDQRTDIWAFGCVLLRDADGPPCVRRRHGVRHVRQHPRSASPSGPPCRPRHPRRFARCSNAACARIRRKRLHDIADARIEIEDVNQLVGSTRSAVAVAPAGPARGRERLAWIAAGVLALALGGTMLVNRREVPATGAELVEFPILPPEGWRFIMGDFAVSPDGRRHRVRGCLEKRLVAVGPIVRRGRSPADCWHRRRAQSILEPRQPVDWLLCQQSAENGAGRR